MPPEEEKKEDPRPEIDDASTQTPKQLPTKSTQSQTDKVKEDAPTVVQAPPKIVEKVIERERPRAPTKDSSA